MNEGPRLETDILRAYFNETRYRDDRYSIEITLISDVEQYGFEVSIESMEPHTHGAFPERRVALEQHLSGGHEGVHVQVNYHLIDNDLNIGRLYIVIDTKTDKELLEIAEGFVYTLYEILSSLGQNFKDVLPEIFKVELMDDIKDKKHILVEKIRESLENRMIEIRDLSGTVVLVEPEELRRLLKSRREFVPLLGPVLNQE